MLGPDSGKWYVHDGQNWVEAQPPDIGSGTPAPSSVVQAQLRSASLLPVVAFGFVVVLCLLSAAGGESSDFLCPTKWEDLRTAICSLQVRKKKPPGFNRRRENGRLCI
jgi:hypothetical protein